jgi:hypothetical protein
MRLQLKTFSIVLLFIATYSFAQTGIGTTTPHVSAKLHVSATDKGFLPPRVTLTAATDVTTIPNPAEGLLVYNLGAVGLQAGYYYWNGANWATMATGTTAGNAVVAGDLVKLYQETYSTTAGKASSSTGYSFTVPASGRYEFNFNCTGWNSNGSSVKLTFNIREGTNVIGSDYHQSTSSNAWVEYEGRFEVNLTAGVTYNAQVVTSTGSRSAGSDWDKIMYKMIAGNLPVNQHVADRNFQLNNNYLSNDGGNEGIRIDNSGNVGIGTATPNASAILDLSSSTQGVLIPRMTASQRAAIANPVAGLVVYQTNANPGNYVYNGSSWDVLSNANYGDVKTGIQTIDHNGWVLLNGRQKTSLSATQQAQATTLGIGAILPNATNAYLVQNGGALGGVTGSNTITIAQNQLPNVTYTGQIADVAHGAVIIASASGVFSRVNGSSWGNAGGGGPTETFNLSIPLNGGVTQQNVNITPKSLSVNTFIYLGL